MKYDFIEHSPGNRMLRLGLGFYRSKFFVRLDIWFFGIRLSQK